MRTVWRDLLAFKYTRKVLRHWVCGDVFSDTVFKEVLSCSQHKYENLWHKTIQNLKYGTRERMAQIRGVSSSNLALFYEPSQHSPYFTATTHTNNTWRLPGWLRASCGRYLRAVRQCHTTLQWRGTAAQLHDCCVRVSTARARALVRQHIDRVAWGSSASTMSGSCVLSLVLYTVSVPVLRCAQLEDQLGLEHNA